MAWVLLDDHFNDHPKAVQAGPVACWLFCCGLMYCRRHQTDGFIPHAAVSTLGVFKPQAAATRLVLVRLWEAVDGGYRVHGYQEMYDDEAVKARQADVRERRREAGRKGGLAKASNARDLLVANASKPLAPNPSKPLAHREGGEGTGSSEVLLLGEKSEEGGAPPLDVWLAELQEDYPQHRVTYGFMTSSSFFEVFQKDPRPAFEVWAEMRANLENHKTGHEWRVKGFVPKLETWLRDGRWKQQHETEPVAQGRTGAPARGKYAGIEEHD